MTRIKEYLELLSNEMEGFQDDVNRLEVVNNNLKGLKVAIDLKELKAELSDHHTQNKRHGELMDYYFTRLESLVKKQRVYTNRVIAIFIFGVLIWTIVFLYVSIELLKPV